MKLEGLINLAIGGIIGAAFVRYNEAQAAGVPIELAFRNPFVPVGTLKLQLYPPATTETLVNAAVAPFFPFGMYGMGESPAEAKRRAAAAGARARAVAPGYRGNWILSVR